jgi:carbamoyltransferase
MRILAFNVTHDSSVCAVNDGEIEFFCKEERVSRIKRDKNPFKSLEIYHSLDLGPIDHVLYLTPSNNEITTEHTYRAFVKKKFNVEMENFSSLMHHICHAGLAYYNSKFDNALIFVIDRNGSMFFIDNTPVARESESVFICKKDTKLSTLYKSFWMMGGFENKKHEIKKEIAKLYEGCDVDINNSLGIVKVYEAATTLIGQSALENGKTMGLASYGEDVDYPPLFLKGNVPINEYFVHLNNYDNTTCFYGDENLIEENLSTNNYQYYANKAKHVQLETQKAVLSLIKKYVETTKIKNVCIVGGYGLNVVANNFYIKNLPDVDFYFEPVADDTGVSIGAAMLKYKIETGKDPSPAKDNFYHYYKKSSIDLGKSSSITEVVDMLMEQKSVAIFDSNPEVGPRALGHRSILFDPRNANAKNIVNKIKQREWYRPFAGVILKSEFSKYFNSLSLEESPYMTINFDAFDFTKKFVPGVVHIDGTCRVQTTNDGCIFELLDEFFKRTGCPMLLNTSFNLAGQPLVQSEEDAISVLNSSTLDAIYFVDTNTIVKKK